MADIDQEYIDSWGDDPQPAQPSPVLPGEVPVLAPDVQPRPQEPVDEPPPEQSPASDVARAAEPAPVAPSLAAGLPAGEVMAAQSQEAAAPAAREQASVEAPGAAPAQPPAAVSPQPQVEAAPAVLAAPAAPTQQPAPPQAPAAANPFMPYAGVKPEHRKAFLDAKYETQGKLLQRYYMQIGEPEKAMSVPGAMRQLRQSETEEITRYALAQAAAGDPRAIGSLAKVYEHFQDGYTLDPKSGVFDPKTRTWTGLKILDEKTGQVVDETSLNQQQIYAMATNMNAAGIAKQNIEQAFAIQKEERAAAAKIAENRSKTTSVRPGEQLVDGSGRLLHSNDNAYRGYDYDENGNLKYIGPQRGGAGAGGAGGRSGKADKPVDSYEPYMGAVENLPKMSEVKFSSPDEASEVSVLTSRIAKASNFKVSPNLAANVALRVVRNPALVKIGLDAATGLPARFVQLDNGDQVTIETGNIDTSKITPDERKAAGLNYLSAQRPPTGLYSGESGAQDFQQTLLAAARDGSGAVRTSIRQSLEALANNAIEAAAKKSPGLDREAARARANQAIEGQMSDIDRRIHVLRNWVPGAAPKAPAQRHDAAAQPKGGAGPASSILKPGVISFAEEATSTARDMATGAVNAVAPLLRKPN